MGKPTLIITGASRGIGAAAACCASEYGAALILTALHLPKLEEVAAQIQQSGGTAWTLSGDLGDVADCQRVVEAALEHTGRIDGLINCGGIVEPISPIAAPGIEAWERNLHINLLGPVMLVHHALPHLRQAKGRVINISTGAAARVAQGWGVYSVAKAGLNHFTRILAAEEPEITTLAVRPGRVDTDMQAFIRRTGLTGMPPDVHRQFIEQYEQGRLLPPEKVGRAIAWMALNAPHKWSGEFIEWNDSRLPEELR